jgi:hypothetical protein
MNTCLPWRTASYINLLRMLRLQAGQALLQFLGQHVGHGDQLGVARCLDRLVGRAAAAPPTAHQRDLQRITAGGMDAPVERQRAQERSPGEGGRTGFEEVTAADA